MKMSSLKSMLLKTVVFSIIFLALSGCAGTQSTLTASQMAEEPLPKETFVPGDVVDVKFLITPEFNENQIVRPDGTITLQLVGKVMVKGKTPEELRNDLIKLYTPELKKPEITVLVRTKNDRRVYVGGEVKTPGVYEMPGEMTLFEAINRAGDLKRPEADPRNVVIVRQKNGKQSGFIVNLQKAREGQEEALVYLQPLDVVYVPPTQITKVNDWVEQCINRMLPRIPVGFGLSP